MRLIQWIRCRLPWPFWFHTPEIIETYDSYTRKLRCTSCGQYFAMSDRHEAVFPWEDDYEQIIRCTYGIARSKL